MKINRESLIFLQGVFEGIFLISERTVTAIAFENLQGDVVDNFIDYFELEKSNLIEKTEIDFYSIENEIKLFLQDTILLNKPTDYEKVAYDIMDYIEFVLNTINEPNIKVRTQKLSFKQDNKLHPSFHYLIHDNSSNSCLVINFF